MSVPPWKQAILERRKKQEIEQQKKTQEEETYLASLPPWKRALVLRQKEKEGKEKPQAQATVVKSDSFTRRQAQVKASEDPRGPAAKSPSWVRGERATPPSAKPTPRFAAPGSPTVGRKSSTVANPSAVLERRGEAVTAAPTVPSTVNFRRINSPDASSKPLVTLRNDAARHNKTDASLVEHKRRSFEEDDPKYADMPAWKKALIMRRRSKSESSKPERRERASLEPSTKKGREEERKEEEEEPLVRQVLQNTTVTKLQSTSAPDSRRNQHPSNTVKPAASQSPTTQRRQPASNISNVTHSQTVAMRHRSPQEESATLPEPSKLQHPDTDKPTATQPKSTVQPSRTRPRKLESKVSAVRSKFERQPGPPPSPKPKPKPPSSLVTQRFAFKPQSEQPSMESPDRQTVSPISAEPPTQRTLSAKSEKPSTPAAKPSQPASSSSRQKPVTTKPAPAVYQKSPTSTQPSSPVPSRPAAPSRPAPSRPTVSKPVPEIINRANPSTANQTNKLVEQEGVTLHPPVFKEVDEWANVTEEDAKFKKLPTWKQALIKRRRMDIARRTGTDKTEDDQTSDRPPTENGYIHTAWSPRNSVVEYSHTQKQQQGKKSKQEVDSKSRENSRLSGSEKQPARPQQPTGVKGSAVKALLDRFNQSGHTTPSNSQTWGQTKVADSTPHRVIMTVSSDSSDDNDDELEEVQLTNIDDLSSEDDDDSGISKGRVFSYNFQRTPPQQRRGSTSSILSDPQKEKATKGLKVSFSDTELFKEHFYPKYDYSDYDDLNEEEEEEETDRRNSTDSSNLGLSQRLHPFLRPGENDRFTSPPTSPPSQNLQGYKPSVLSSYSNSLEQHLNSSLSETPSGEDEVDGEVEEESRVGRPPSLDFNDFYTSMKRETAALMW